MDALAVTAGIVALVGVAVVFLRGGLLGGCLAVLVAGTCFSVPFYKTEGAVPLTADRLPLERAREFIQHNAALSLLTETGLVLLVALGAYLTNGMFHDASVLPMASMTIFFLAGATAALRPLTAEPVSVIVADG